MNRLNEIVSNFNNFIRHADDAYTMEELLKTGFFKNEDEVLNYFTEIYNSGFYVENERYYEIINNRYV